MFVLVSVLLTIIPNILLGLNWFFNPNEFNKSTEPHEYTEMAKDPNRVSSVPGFVKI